MAKESLRTKKQKFGNSMRVKDEVFSTIPRKNRDKDGKQYRR